MRQHCEVDQDGELLRQHCEVDQDGELLRQHCEVDLDCELLWQPCEFHQHGCGNIVKLGVFLATMFLVLKT